ncbi:hypothetical protein [Solirhodobacter olei]|uniref:hypothetical protein n=1 Tax=Solirhodobacter olei TaxID=2493082 RepID=UPI000FDC4724|nr:hypothetical protein [Solirhodobacter olei]
MEPDDQADLKGRSSARVLIHAIWISGLALPALMGVVARETLRAQNVSVVTLPDGLALILPLSVWFEIPFLVLALITRWLLARTIQRRPQRFSFWLTALIGAFLAMAAFDGYSLFNMLMYQGPGGLAEAVSMTLALWMLTVPFLLIQSGGAALAGGAIVSLALWVSSKIGYRVMGRF